MRRRALIERMERSDALMEAIREELALSREQRERHAAMDERHAAIFERDAATFEEQAALFADTREFIREQTVRLQRFFERHERALADLSDQIQANTSATWAMVDILRGGSAPRS